MPGCWFMGRLVVDEEAVSGKGLPVSCGVEAGFWASCGVLELDLRFEPNPRPLKREFIELIETLESVNQGGRERKK